MRTFTDFANQVLEMVIGAVCPQLECDMQIPSGADPESFDKEGGVKNRDFVCFIHYSIQRGEEVYTNILSGLPPPAGGPMMAPGDKICI